MSTLYPRVRCKQHPQYVDSQLLQYDSLGVLTNTKDLTAESGASNCISDEVILDMPVSKQKLIYKNVLHETKEVSFGANVPCAYELTHIGTGSKNLYQHTRLSGVEQDFGFNASEIVPSLYNALEPLALYRAVADVKPSYEDYVDGVNIYNIILEFGDLKRLLTLFNRKVVKTDTDYVASNWLGVNFGALPLVSDISAIFNILTKLDKAIDRWNDAARKGIVYNSHTTVQKAKEPLSRVVSIPSNSIWRVGTFEVEFRSNGTFEERAHMYFKPKYIPDSKRFKAYVKAFGVDKPISGVWDSIPFSWIIDYFISIGEVIESWEEGIDSVFTYDYVSSGTSIKFNAPTLSYQYKSWTDDPDWDYSLGGIAGMLDNPITITNYKVYKRERRSLGFILKYSQAIPEDIKLQANIGLWQASYLAALVALKLK